MPDDAFDDLARRLQAMHRRVAGLTVGDDVKGRITHRLLAVTNLAKHDIARAARRLDALERDLATGRHDSAEADHDAAG